MPKVIVVDKDQNFLDDLSTRLVLGGYPEINLVTTLSNAQNVHTAIQRFEPDVLAVCASIMEDLADWEFADVQVVGYARDKEGLSLLDKSGMANFGIVKNPPHMLNLLRGPIPAKNDTGETGAKKESRDWEEPGEKAPEKTGHNVQDSDYAAFMEWKRQQEEKQKKGVREQESPVTDDEPDCNTLPGSVPEETVPESGSMLKEKARQRRQAKTQQDADSAWKDILEAKKKAKVVTVYAAKGGVGKTTIATEVAVYLALTAHGRGRYRVCILDYNIDFGDVRATLGFDNESMGMYEWAMDISERISRGENPDGIEYSRAEIERYLQVMDKTGLYGLCAPLSHMDSMDIERAELRVMLRNIIDNGEFDFIICDTGNNTRDSSVFAIEEADYILLVATQDVTTATCNSAAIEALEELDIDTSKIRLVVNNVMSAKNTGISVQEVIDVFPYECVAAIKHDTDIIKANNLSRPIVFQSNHPVTKEMQKIIAFITGNGELVPEKPKKKLFSFGKRK